jgi:hypothetical protein
MALGKQRFEKTPQLGQSVKDHPRGNLVSISASYASRHKA